LFPNGWPVLLQIAGEFLDGHPVDPRATLVGLHPLQCPLQVFPLTYFLHELIRASWVFGCMPRRERFGHFPSRCSGFTRRRGVEVQVLLGVLLPHAVPEMHVLLTSPLVRAFGPRSRLGLSVSPPFGFRSASISGSARESGNTRALRVSKLRGRAEPLWLTFHRSALGAPFPQRDPGLSAILARICCLGGPAERK